MHLPHTSARWAPLALQRVQRCIGWRGRGRRPARRAAVGEGSPSATGGASVAHASAAPGDYTATLQVCDKDGACDTDSATVHVTKRETTLGYTGPLDSAPSKTVTATATLVDEYGEPVAGKKVTFQLGSHTAVGTTDSDGKASATPAGPS